MIKKNRIIIICTLILCSYTIFPNGQGDMTFENIRVVDEADLRIGLRTVIVDTLNEEPILQSDENGLILGKLPEEEKILRIEPKSKYSYRPREIKTPYIGNIIQIERTRSGNLLANAVTLSNQRRYNEAAYSLMLLSEEVEDENDSLRFRAMAMEYLLPELKYEIAKDDSEAINFRDPRLDILSQNIENINLNEYYYFDNYKGSVVLNNDFTTMIDKYREIKSIDNNSSTRNEIFKIISKINSDVLANHVINNLTLNDVKQIRDLDEIE